MTNSVDLSERIAAPLNSSRMVALDGLRGIAVILVLVEHFTYNEWVRGWSPGAIGVKTFFVLSGFLITGILLDARNSPDRYRAARHFFTRRARRLLPAFLIAIAIGSLLGIGGLQQDWVWHMTYLSNVQVWLQSSWSGAGHFWTLALEQQFYLLWFPVIVLLPRHWLGPVVIGLLFAAPIFRLAIVFGASPFLDVLLPAQADALAAGALLALILRGDISTSFLSWLTRPPIIWALLGTLFILLSIPAFGLKRPEMINWVVVPSLIAFAALAIIGSAVTQPQRLAFLSAPILVWIGTISYGVYIYHYFTPQFFVFFAPSLAEAHTAAEKTLRLLGWILFSFTLAAISWYLVEKPMLRKPARSGPHDAIADKAGLRTQP